MPPAAEEKCCQLCKQPFSLTKRRHYCSRCTRTVCANCSTAAVGFFASLRKKETDNICVKCKRELAKAAQTTTSPMTSTAPLGSPRKVQRESPPPAAQGGTATPVGGPNSSSSTTVVVPSNRPVFSSSQRSTHSDEGGAVKSIAKLIDAHNDDAAELNTASAGEPCFVDPNADSRVATSEEHHSAAAAAAPTAQASAARREQPRSCGMCDKPFTDQRQPLLCEQCGRVVCTTCRIRKAGGVTRCLQCVESSLALGGGGGGSGASVVSTSKPIATGGGEGTSGNESFAVQSVTRRSMLPSNASMSLSRSIVAGASFAGEKGQQQGGQGAGQVAGSFRPTSLLMRRGAAPPPRAPAATNNQQSDLLTVQAESVRKRHTSTMKMQSAALPESVKNASFLFGTTPMGSLPPQFFAALRRDALGGIAVSSSAWQNFLALAPKQQSSTALDNMSLVLDVQGALARDHFHACINLLVERHSMLRTAYRDGGLLVFPPGDCDYKVLYFNEGKNEKEVRQSFEGEIAAPFSIISPMFRVRIMSSRSHKQHTIAFVFHRAVACAASIRIFMDDLRVLYQHSHQIVSAKGWDPKTQTFKSSTDVVELQMQLVQRLLPRMPAAYEDYCVAQKEYLASAGDHRQYWLGKIQSAAPLELPTTGHRAASLSFLSAVVPVVVDNDAVDNLANWARRECGATSDVPILAAFALLLKRFTGQDMVSIAVQQDVRSALFDDTFGPMNNFLTLNIETADSSSCSNLVSHVRQLLVESLQHKDFPFAKIAPDATNMAAQGRFPFAQASFVSERRRQDDAGQSLTPFLLGIEGPGQDFAGLQLTPSTTVERARGSMFEITLHHWESRGGSFLAIEYATALHDEASMKRMASCFGELIKSMQLPSTTLTRASLLPSDQLQQQLVDFNSNRLSETAVELSKRRGVHGLVNMATPSRPALTMPEQRESLTYAELDEKSNRLAKMLREKYAVGSDIVVAIAMHRSVTQILCVLSVLKAGGAYLPLDLSYPLDRLSFMLQDSAVACVLSSTEVRQSSLSPLFAQCSAPVLSVKDDFETLVEGFSAEALTIDIPPQSTTYVIYTSGSTGKPKGVVMNHKALTNLVLWQNSYLFPRYADRLHVLQFSPISFDVSFQEMFTTWSQGGTLVMVSEQLRLDPLSLIRFMSTHDIHRLFLPFVALSHICETALDTNEFPSTLTDIITAGEQLVISRPVATLLDKLTDKKIVLHNHYGPSETHVCSYYELRGDPKKWMLLPPIGAPISNTQLYVLDNDLAIVPVGVVGELFIAGDCLGTGYLNRPEVTNATFVPCPFSSASSDRMYKTGDLVQMLPDGNLVYVRRKDTQVKVRGFRIELGEIESRLSQHEHVKKCCVIVREDTPNDKQIVAYVVLSKDCPDSRPVEMLKTHLKAGMPDYMVPSAVVFLDALPLTPSGKINRKGLPAPDIDAAISATTIVPPSTETEIAIAKIWAEVLRKPVASLSAASSFFDVGGHSLSITKVVSRINAALGVDLPVAAAFKAPTIRHMAQATDALRGTSQVSSRNESTSAEEELPATLLTYNEQSMAFLSLSQPEHAAVYNISLQGKLHGEFSVSAISDAFDAVLKMHAALRTTYHQDPETGLLARRVRGADEQELDVNIIQLQEDDDDDDMPHEALVEVLQAESRKPFNLAQDSLMRVRLYRTAKFTILQVVFHHIATDLWSLDLILDDVIAALGGARSEGSQGKGPTTKTATYLDYAKYMHRMIERGDLAKSAVAWKSMLGVGSRELPVLDMPTDFPRPPVQSYNGRIKVVQFSPEQCAQLRHMCATKGTTMYVALLSLLFVVLRKYTRQEEVVIGTPMGCRNVQRFEHTVGYFINSIAVLQRFPGQGETFSELLQRCKEYLMQALEHQEYPFPLVADKIVGTRSSAYPPVFQTLFTYQKPPLRDELAPFVMYQDGHRMSLGPSGEWESIAVPSGFAMLDLVFQFAEINTAAASGGSICGTIEYNCDLFAESTIDGLWNVMQTILRQVHAQPGTAIADLHTTSQAQRPLLIEAFNSHPASTPLLSLGPNIRVHLDSPECHFVAMFAKVVADVPNAIALQFGDGSAAHKVQFVTYKELDEKTNAIARRLQEVVGGGKVAKDTIIGVSIRRSIEMIMAMVAVMKVGAAYVPMDPNYPADRLQYMTDDSQSALVLCSEKDSHLFANIKKHLYVEEFAALLPTTEHPQWTETITPQHLAYVIYTSGSTGKPKGVLLEQRGLVNMAYAIRESYLMRYGVSKFLLFASSSFDASALEIFCPLLNGCAVVMLSAESLVGETLARGMEATGVTTAVLPPSVLSVMPEELFPPACLEVLVTAGEAINDELLTKWRSKVHMINGYGPTENTVCSTVCDYDEDKVLLIDSPNKLAESRAAVDSGKFCASRTPPIGRACPNSRCYVVDENMQLVGVGIPGELLVTGPGVARGYHNLPERTITSFIPNTFEPHVNPVMYRTGDLVRWLPCGQLEFLGRIDGQVKLRGYRIELGEIEAVILKSSPLLSDCAVDIRTLSTGKALVAYMVLKKNTASQQEEAGQSLSVQHVREFLRKHLPEYMVPAAFVTLDALPLSPSGKVDRRSLPTPYNIGHGSDSSGEMLIEKASPNTPTQAVLLLLVKEVLGSNSVSIADDFFEAGGHSLAAMQLAARLKESLGVEVPISKVFECSKLTSLAELVDSLRAAGEPEIAALQPRFEDEATSSDGMTFPLSFNQEALWFAYTMDKQSAAFNVSLAAKISSPNFSKVAMTKALIGLVVLNPMLRCRFEGSGSSPVQHVLSVASPAVVEVVWSNDEADEDARSARIEADCHQALDLEAGEVVRLYLYAESSTAPSPVVTHMALLFHHIVMDLGSMEDVVQQLGNLYVAAATPSTQLHAVPASSSCVVSAVAKKLLREKAFRHESCMPVVTYVDYVFYQREVLASTQGDKLFGYWQRQLAGYPATTPIPCDFVRPPHPSYKGGAEVVSIDDRLAEGVVGLAKQLHTTPLSIYLSALYAWLFRVTGQADVVVGMPVSGRTKVELEHVVGDFVNLAPLRVQLDEAGFATTSFRQLVKIVRSVVVGALMHAEYPFQLMVQNLQQYRDPSRSPMFQVLLVHEKPHHTMRDMAPFILGDEGGTLRFGGAAGAAELTFSSIATKERSCQYDLVFALSEGENGRIDFRIQYASDLFLPSTVVRFASQFVALLGEAVRDSARPISGLSMLSAEERTRLELLNNATFDPFPELEASLCLHQVFEQAVSKFPDNIAVINESSGAVAGLTYKELNRRANALARKIREAFSASYADVPLASRTVCLYLPRGMEYIATIVGCAKSCAAYTPIDIKIPMDRATYISEDSGCSIILTNRALEPQAQGLVVGSRRTLLFVEDVLGAALAEDDDENLTCTSTGSSIIYLIYTSGSTGKPKGVQCHHKGLVNVTSWFVKEHKVVPGDVSAQALGAAFDPVNIELWPYLISGASIVVMPDDAKFGGPEATISFLCKHRVTHLTFPTSLSQIIFDVGVFPEEGMAMRSWTCGGDKFKGTSRPLPFSVINAYGPTETCILCSQYPVNFPVQSRSEHTGKALPPDPSRTSLDPPLGTATANTALYVVDRFMNLVPRGACGELLVGGAQVGLGYRNRDETTAAVFVPDPFKAHQRFAIEPQRVYHTGDLVRLDEHFNIHFVGRKDFQVKIRGFRIELGEIEDQLLSAGGLVRQACVMPHENASTGEKVLVGYVNLSEDALEPGQAREAGSHACTTRCREIRSIILKKLKSSLPDYMVPSTIVVLEKLLPLTANGKVDRSVLPQLIPLDLCGGQEEEAKQRDFAPPVTDVEKKMCGIWEELLQTKPIGLTDNWYDRGGSSLTSTMLLSRMRQVFQMEVSIQNFFADPTVNGLLKIVHEKGHIDVAHKLTEVLITDSETLDPNISVHHLPKFNPAAEPASFFVTGVTGFLGAFILMDLLQRTRANVFCLVRGKTEAEASQRIFANLTSYKLVTAERDVTELLERIIPVVGDLSHPNFGLSSARFAELAASVDVIIHNGALVNFSYPYVSLKAANVTGTITTLRLATTHHVKPVHYVSTLSTVPSPDAPGSRIVSERLLAAPGDDLHGGYTQSKWVAEKLVQKAGLERGLPVTILRPGRITGDSQTGATNLDDFLNLLIKGTIQMKIAPLMHMPCDMTPVDFCAAAINTVATHHVTRLDCASSFVYHVTNPSMMPWKDVIDAVIAAGKYQGISFAPYPVWRSEHLLKLTNESHCALIPLVPMFSPEFEKEIEPLDVQVANLTRLLEPLGLKCPAVTDKLIQTYIHYFIESGFLPPPV